MVEKRGREPRVIGRFRLGLSLDGLLCDGEGGFRKGRNKYKSEGIVFFDMRTDFWVGIRKRRR